MRRRTAMTLITPITIPRAIFAAAAAAHRAPAGRHGGSRVGRHRVLKHGGAGERPDERADHGSNYGHGNTHHRADQSADQRAPSRALQGAVSPREPEPQPPSISSPRSASARTSVVVQRPTVWKSVNQP